MKAKELAEKLMEFGEREVRIKAGLGWHSPTECSTGLCHDEQGFVCVFTKKDTKPLDYNYKEIHSHFVERQRKSGFIGLDFNCTVIAICELRDKGIRSVFEDNVSTAQNYWSQKKDFGELHFADAQEVLKLAHNITVKEKALCKTQ